MDTQFRETPENLASVAMNRLCDYDAEEAENWETTAARVEAFQVAFTRLAAERLAAIAAKREDRFQADTRLLAHFGQLYRVARRVTTGTRDAESLSDGLEQLETATILPPDIEAAVEGPRGRAAIGGRR